MEYQITKARCLWLLAFAFQAVAGIFYVPYGILPYSLSLIVFHGLYISCFLISRNIDPYVGISNFLFRFVCLHLSPTYWLIWFSIKLASLWLCIFFIITQEFIFMLSCYFYQTVQSSDSKWAFLNVSDNICSIRLIVYCGHIHQFIEEKDIQIETEENGTFHQTELRKMYQWYHCAAWPFIENIASFQNIFEIILHSNLVLYLRLDLQKVFHLLVSADTNLFVFIRQLFVEPPTTVDEPDEEIVNIV